MKTCTISSWSSDVVPGLHTAVQEPIKPVMVDKGPVKQNKLMGKEVDLLGIPAPKWHHLDGGRFLGTCDGVVTKDPETGWVNISL